jgi:hypothetical protein
MCEIKSRLLFYKILRLYNYRNNKNICYFTCQIFLYFRWGVLYAIYLLKFSLLFNGEKTCKKEFTLYIYFNNLSWQPLKGFFLLKQTTWITLATAKFSDPIITPTSSLYLKTKRNSKKNMQNYKKCNKNSMHKSKMHKINSALCWNCSSRFRDRSRRVFSLLQNAAEDALKT